MVWLNYLGAGITAALGMLGLLAPRTIADFVSIEPVGPIGKSEIRATYGGFFLLFGIVCLFSGTPATFHILGYGWLGAAAGRLFSFLPDRAFSGKNLAAVAFEAAIGFLLLL